MSRWWLRQGSFSMAERVVGMLAGVVTFSLLARSLTTADFGAWTLFMTLLTLLEMWRNGLVQSGYLRYASGLKGAALSALTTAAAGIGLVVWVIVSVGCLLMAELIAAWTMTPLLAGLVLQVPLIAGATLGRSLMSWVLQADARFADLCLVRITWSGLMVAGLGAGVLRGEADMLSWAATAMAISQACAALVAAVLVRRRHNLSVVWSVDDVRRLLDHGRFSMGTMLGSSLYKGADAFMISAFLGPAAVGLYSAASRLADYVEVPLQAAGNILVPRLSALARTDPLGAVKKARKAIALASLLAVVMSAGLLLTGKWLLVLLAGEAYLPAFPILAVLAVFNLMRPLDRFTGITLDATGHPDANLLKVLIALSVNLTGNLIVLRFAGGLALPMVAMCSVISTAAGVLCGEAALRRRLSRGIFTAGA